MKIDGEGFWKSLNKVGGGQKKSEEQAGDIYTTCSGRSVTREGKRYGTIPLVRLPCLLMWGCMHVSYRMY